MASMRHPNLTEVLDVDTSTPGVAAPCTTWSARTSPAAASATCTIVGDCSPSQVVLRGLMCPSWSRRSAPSGHGARFAAAQRTVFGDDGRLRVADLGLNRPGRRRVVDDLEWRRRHVAPTAKSDVYSLALCLLESVTGSVPFVGDSAVSMLAQRVDRLLPVSADLGPLATVFGRRAPRRRRPLDGGRVRSALHGTVEKLPRLPLQLLSGAVDAPAASPPQRVPPAPPVAPTAAAEKSRSCRRRKTCLLLRPPPPPDAAGSGSGRRPRPCRRPRRRPCRRLHVDCIIDVVRRRRPGRTRTGRTWRYRPDRPDRPDRRRAPHRFPRRRAARRRGGAAGRSSWSPCCSSPRWPPGPPGGSPARSATRCRRWPAPRRPRRLQHDQRTAVGRRGGRGGRRRRARRRGDPHRPRRRYLLAEASHSPSSSAPAPCYTLPELAGLTVAEATEQLAALDLVLEETDCPFDDEVPVEAIVSWRVPDQPALVAATPCCPAPRSSSPCRPGPLPVWCPTSRACRSTR
ncbi:MAG: hypothetical protein R2713_08575 [Ilumatobacteraceae bacterium]